MYITMILFLLWFLAELFPTEQKQPALLECMRKTFRTRFWTQFRTPDRRTRKWPFLTHNNNYISSNDENCE